MSQQRRAVGNTVSDLTGPRFEPLTSRSRDERVTARPTGQYESSLGGLINLMQEIFSVFACPLFRPIVGFGATVLLYPESCVPNY